MNNKSILVLDTPTNCEDCLLFREAQDFNATISYCMSGKGKELFMVKEKGVSENCPLKPLPHKNKYDVEKYGTVDYENNITLGHYLNKGWNDCIDEILGDE